MVRRPRADLIALVARYLWQFAPKLAALCQVYHLMYGTSPIRGATEMSKYLKYSFLYQVWGISTLTGVIQAKMNSGTEDRPSSHLHPKVGATANAKATSKQAPRAQKH